MKRTNKEADGTSFHNTTVTASVAELKAVCGEPDYDSNDGQDKVNFEWTMETSTGKVFTIYDWKEYRSISESEQIEWHIGGHSGSDTSQAADELQAALDELS